MTRTLQALVLVYSVQLFARGTDLLTGDIGSKVGLYEATPTPVVWGWAAIIASVMLVASLVFQNARMLVVSCLTAFAVYAMYGVEAVSRVVRNTPLDNWRLVTDHWCSALVMLVLAVSVSFRHDIAKILKAKGVSLGVG